MKKTLSYLCLVICAGITFSSCLGDTKSFAEGNSRFAVISEISGVKVAKIDLGNAGYFLTSDQLSSYAIGDAMLINYKFDFNNYINQEGVIRADILSPTSSEDIYRLQDQKYIQTEAADTLLANNFAFKGLENAKYASNEFYLDKWLLKYAADVSKEQNINITVTYDPTKQVDSKGNSLSELTDPTYVLDIKLVTSGTANDGEQKITKEGSTVVNFADFRRAVSPAISEKEKFQNVYIWFRYNKDTDKEKNTYIQNAGKLLYVAEG